MKNFRSSKNLRVVEVVNKEDGQLRTKIKQLQEQIELLQKSNLNIFIPLSEQEQKPATNYQAIINKLKTQVLTLQQEIQRQKNSIKKLQNQKEMQKITLQNEIGRISQENKQLVNQKEELQIQVQDLQQQLQQQSEKRKERQKQAIELRVQNKFIKEDLATQKKRTVQIQRKYQQLHSHVLNVSFNSRIYKSKQTKVTAIETSELSALKSYIEELQQRIKELLTLKQQRVTLSRREDIGEEIVRLKKNIDLQLGLEVDDKTTKSFMSAYNQAHNKFNQLLTDCRQGRRECSTGQK